MDVDQSCCLLVSRSGLLKKPQSVIPFVLKKSSCTSGSFGGDVIQEKGRGVRTDLMKEAWKL